MLVYTNDIKRSVMGVDNVSYVTELGALRDSSYDTLYQLFDSTGTEIAREFRYKADVEDIYEGLTIIEANDIRWIQLRYAAWNKIISTVVDWYVSHYHDSADQAYAGSCKLAHELERTYSMTDVDIACVVCAGMAYYRFRMGPAPVQDILTLLGQKSIQPDCLEGGRENEEE